MEYNNNYSKKPGSSWQYYRDETALTGDGPIKIFILVIIIVLCLNLNKK